MPPAPTRQSKDSWLLDTLRAARAGSDDALGALFETFRPYLFHIAACAAADVPRSKDARSDLVASALRRAVDGFDQFRGQTAQELAGWLRGILLHHISDVARRYRANRRRAAREVSLDADGPGDRLRAELVGVGPTPEQSVLRLEEEQQVRAALERLPAAYAQALLLRQRDGLTFEEVGHRLGRSAEAARHLFDRALKQLRAALEADHVG
jgi:RNA polymerase sigma-70 factor (ECF subfamily)